MCSADPNALISNGKYTVFNKILEHTKCERHDSWKNSFDTSFLTLFVRHSQTIQTQKPLTYALMNKAKKSFNMKTTVCSIFRIKRLTSQYNPDKCFLIRCSLKSLLSSKEHLHFMVNQKKPFGCLNYLFVFIYHAGKSLCMA